MRDEVIATEFVEERLLARFGLLIVHSLNHTMPISVRQAWLDTSAWQPFNGLESADGILLNPISERGSFFDLVTDCQYSSRTEFTDRR